MGKRVEKINIKTGYKEYKIPMEDTFVNLSKATAEAKGRFTALFLLFFIPLVVLYIILVEYFPLYDSNNAIIFSFFGACVITGVIVYFKIENNNMWHEHHNRENDIAKKEKARLFFEKMVNNFIADLNKTRVKSGMSELTPEEIEKVKPKVIKILQETIKENNL